MSNLAIARAKARKYGLGEWFVRQMNAENPGGGDATSRAGALGPAQIMPQTAAAWGVRNPHDPNEAYDAAAKHMASYVKQFGSVENALRAYNAGPGAVQKSRAYSETNNYVKKILGGSNPRGLSRTLSNNSRQQGASTTRIPGFNTPGINLPSVAGTSVNIVEPQVDRASFEDARRRSVLGEMIARHNPNSFLLRSGLLSTQEPVLADYVTNKSSTVKIPGIPGLNIPGSRLPGLNVRTPGSPAASADVSAPTGGGGRRGKVHLAPTANRPGVSIQPQVMDFASRIAGQHGRALTIGTGTNHNQFVLGTHNESEHWTGHGADIPARGAELTRLGQDALITAGVPRSIARKQRGGVYNINSKGQLVPSGAPRKYQVLFNTYTGGNHFNHLHIGVR